VGFAQEHSQQFIDVALREIKLENYDVAFTYLDSAKALSPENALIPMIRADIYKKKGNMRLAISSYDEAVKINPGFHQAFFERSLLRYKIEDHRDYSLQDIDKAISLQPSNTVYLVQKAYYLVNTNNPQTGFPDREKAIAILSIAIQMAPDSAQYLNLRGRVKFKYNQTLTAINDFSKAIEMDDENPIFYNNRGEVYLFIEEYNSAISDFTSAIALDPLNETYIQKRGHAKFNRGYYNAAVDDFTLAINTIFRKISLTPGKIGRDHHLNEELQENYLFRGSALLQLDAASEACNDFKSARGLGSRRASNYVKRYCR